MKVLRKSLGILVMVAGILGLVLSLAGLVGVWAVRPTIAGYLDTTLTAVNASVDSSQKAMEVTKNVLGSTIASIDSTAEMLSNTAATLETSQPMLESFTVVMSDTLPSTLNATANSLKTAQKAADVLDSTLKSLDNFRSVLSGAPLIGSLIEQPKEAYNPNMPLADSLGEMATNLESLPKRFSDMSKNMTKVSGDLATVQSSLMSMSENVASISKSLKDYEAMLDKSQSSMQELSTMLTSLQGNLNNILNTAAAVLSLFFAWLLVAQVVIFSQGWELFQGTAGRMEGGAAKPTDKPAAPVVGDEKEAPTGLANGKEKEESPEAA